MPFIVILRRKCTLAASRAASWSRWVCVKVRQKTEQTDGRTPDRYITLIAIHGRRIIIYTPYSASHWARSSRCGYLSILVGTLVVMVVAGWKATIGGRVDVGGGMCSMKPGQPGSWFATWASRISASRRRFSVNSRISLRSSVLPLFSVWHSWNKLSENFDAAADFSRKRKLNATPAKRIDWMIPFAANTAADIAKL